MRTLALLLAAGCTEPSPRPTPPTPAASTAGDARATNQPVNQPVNQPMTLASVVTELLDLANAGPPSGQTVKGALSARAAKTETGNSNLTAPAWAKGTRGLKDVFLSMSGDIAGIAIWEDDRGWGTYAEVAVTRGSRADVEAITGPLAPVPRSPDDFHSGEKLAAYVPRAGKTVRVFVELDKVDKTQVRRVTIHFQT